MNERKIIAAMQISLDGLIEGPEGEVDWVGPWSDSFDLLSQIDTCILGGGMYPGYEQYWLGILADPDSPSALTGQLPTKEEVAYALFAEKTPHVVVSKRLSEVTLPSARVVDDLDEIRRLKAEPGNDIYAVGGATPGGGGGASLFYGGGAAPGGGPGRRLLWGGRPGGGGGGGGGFPPPLP